MRGIERRGGGFGEEPEVRGTMKVVAFVTDYIAVDWIIDHFKLTFRAEKPPPSRVSEQVTLEAAEERMEYFS